jgi:hypothetical protein
MLRANMGIRAHPRLRQRRARSEPATDPTTCRVVLGPGAPAIQRRGPRHPELDNELWAIPREQVFPEHVEIEFRTRHASRLRGAEERLFSAD